MRPAVSVIIPTYNRAHLLGNAIESVLAQTYSDFELVIVDDGSTDDTADLVRGYLSKAIPCSDRIRYISQENQGKSVALNTALLNARGEWVAFLDSDDVWLPEKLERQFCVLERFPECRACFANCQFVNNPLMDTTFFGLFGRRFEQPCGKLTSSAKFLLESPCASIITVVCRADLARKIRFDPELRFTEDYDFMFRLALETDLCFVNSSLALADRSAPSQRHRGTSAEWDDLDFRFRCEQYRYEKWIKMGPQLPSELRRMIIRRLRAVHSSWANRYLKSGNYDGARQAISKASKYQLTARLAAKWILTALCPALMKGFAQKRGLSADAAAD